MQKNINISANKKLKYPQFFKLIIDFFTIICYIRKYKWAGGSRPAVFTSG